MLVFISDNNENYRNYKKELHKTNYIKWFYFSNYIEKSKLVILKNVTLLKILSVTHLMNRFVMYNSYNVIMVTTTQLTYDIAPILFQRNKLLSYNSSKIFRKINFFGYRTKNLILQFFKFLYCYYLI